MKMYRVPYKGRSFPICESCVEGHHITYGQDHRKTGSDCKNLSDDGKTQCNCYPDVDWLQEILERDREMILRDVHSIDDLLKKAEELIPGGLADGVPDSKFPQEQVDKGIEVEYEHTDNPAIAKEIAQDHLMENDEYYDYLEDMEDLMKESSIDAKRADELLKKYDIF